MLILQPLALVFLIGASAGPEPDPINPCDSITIESTRHALEALRRASSLHGGEKPSRWLFEGTLVVEGHLPRPGMVLTRPVRIELACDGHDRLHLLEVTGEANATSTETTLIVGKRVASQGSSDEPFKELTGTEALATVASVRQWIPATASYAGISVPPSCRLGAPVQYQGENEQT